MVSTLGKLGYSARQGARVAWYMGHYFASQRFHKAKGEDDVRREKPRAPGPTPERLMRDLATVFQQDLAHVEAGHYPMPRDRDGPPLELLRRSRMYFADLPEATERRTERRGDEVYSAELKEKLPAYFLQNFHYQTGGYLTEESAELYDLQVDVLFSGSTNAMRRHCLVPLAEFMRGRDQRKVKLADIACGTGRFLDAVKQAYPRIQAVASDLSEAYLAEAAEYQEPWSGIEYVPSNAETLPFADGELDVVSCVYLFH
ncbi:MAG: class I SAM-dependent methyltransferase, partial [Rhizobiales bacterium]|nr:class I SAM-dependent methyltransferase [Hyphomicrobiales bacterium]